MRNRAIRTVTMVWLGAAILAGCNTDGDDALASEGERGAPVEVQAVQRADVTEVVRYGVDLSARSEVKIYPLVSEKILSFPWEDGDEIEEGEVVARIRKSALSKSISQMGAQVESADIRIASLQSTVERSEKLLADGVISAHEFDDLKASLNGAKADRKALKAGKGQLAVSAGNATIKAPTDGVIAYKSAEEGDVASPGFPLCSIISVDPLEATIDLVEKDIARVSVGQSVVLSLDAYGDRKFVGTIERILPFLDTGTRTNRAIVTVGNPVDEVSGQRLLKPGMYGRAQIVVGSHSQVIVAPEEALLIDADLLEQQTGVELRRVFVVDDTGHARARVVTLGVRDGTRWVILDGLEEGDLLVVRGQHGLEDGQSVEIKEG